MTLPTITRNGTKLSRHSSFTNILRPLLRPEKKEKQLAPFAVALAHEVRNPLTNINLSVELLKAAIKDDVLKVYLDIILRGSTRINDLINDILKGQNIDVVPTEKYSIHQLLDEVVGMAEDRIRLKKISVWKDYTKEDCRTVLDKAEVKIALTNIVVNAIDAMSVGKGQLKLTTRCIDGKYVITIKDNGCGISAENLKNIFKPFFTNKPGGLGVGLASTYQILKSNHIEVKVESEEGLGTRFILLFNKPCRPDNIELCYSKHELTAITV